MTLQFAYLHWILLAREEGKLTSIVSLTKRISYGCGDFFFGYVVVVLVPVEPRQRCTTIWNNAGPGLPDRGPANIQLPTFHFLNLL